MNNNNNTVTLSGMKPAQQQQQQQQLSHGDPHEDRMPSPPHQPRPCMPGLPPPKRGHSPRRPSPNRSSHPQVAMVQPGYHHTQSVDGLSNGRDHAQEEGGQHVENDVVISPVVSCLILQKVVVCIVLKDAWSGREAMPDHSGQTRLVRSGYSRS